MKNLIRLEEAGIFILSLYLFSTLEFAWWWFPALLFLPDVGMFGYLLGSKLGAFFYNFLHHRLTATFVCLLGMIVENNVCLLAGIILFAHISFDRIMGYGLKYSDSFNHTHLGMIGKEL